MLQGRASSKWRPVGDAWADLAVGLGQDVLHPRRDRRWASADTVGALCTYRKERLHVTYEQSTQVALMLHTQWPLGRFPVNPKHFFLFLWVNRAIILAENMRILTHNIS